MKRTLVVVMVAIPVVVALLAGVALADQGHRGGPGPCTDPIPADKQAKLLEKFGDQGIDANKDGILTCDEVKAFFKANPQLRPWRRGGFGPCADPIPDERQAMLLKKFGDKGIDANKDGKLTCEEVKAFFKANPQLRPRHGRGPGHGPGPWQCTDPIPTERQAKLLEKFGDKGIDANKDGILTCDEVKAFFKANPQLRPHRRGGPGPCTDPIPDEKQARLLERFGSQGIDANGDGKLTCEEVKAFFAAKAGDKKAGCAGKGSHDGAQNTKAPGAQVTPATPTGGNGASAVPPTNKG